MYKMQNRLTILYFYLGKVVSFFFLVDVEEDCEKKVGWNYWALRKRLLVSF